MPNQYYNFDESAASMSMSMSTYEYPSFDSSSSYYSPSSSPYVDCTLSLGTPSTHLHNHNQVQSSRPERHRSAKNHSPSSTKPKNNLGGGSSHNDPIFARRCANCDTTSTPLWRNGPRGPKSLCNACGIRFKKEERRAAAAAAAAAANSQSSEFHQNSYSWSQQYSQAPSTANEYMFMGEDEDGRDSSNDSNVPFFSWCLNVADRGSFVDEYTTY